LVAVTFDLPGKTFRDDLYKKYKAQRVKAPDELYAQISRVKDVVRALNIPIYEKAGFEADDVLATLSDQHEQDPEARTVIVTGDLDTLQLVDEQTVVFTPKRGLSDTITYDIAGVHERYGLAPDQIIDFKALAGDSSDNIPGVKGVGQKTAADLLQKYKTLDGVYKEAKKKNPQIKPAVVKKLLASEAEAFLSQKLATIIRKVPAIKLDLKKCSLADYDREQVAELFQELQFQSLLAKLPDSNHKVGPGFDKPAGKKDAGKISRRCEIIDTLSKFNKFFSKLKSQSAFVFDTETTSLDPLTGDIVGISFAWQAGEAYYVIPFSKIVWEKLRPIFADSKIKKSGHNLKFDIEVLAAAGVPVSGIADDSMIISYLLDPGTRAHNLEQLAFAKLGYEMQPITDLIGKGKKQLSFAQVPLKNAAAYSCEDAEITWRLVAILRAEIKAVAVQQKKATPFRPYLQFSGKSWDMISLYEKVERPLLEVLAEMETTGIKLDQKSLARAAANFGTEIETLRRHIYKIAGAEFNISSPAQLREILFTKLKLPTTDIKKTKTGYSTAVGELMKLRRQSRVVDKIFRYRELTKLKNTYVDALPKLVNTKTGRLHTSFNQTVTATGRLSSSNPNLQNIPVRSDEGRKIRRAFVAAPGYKLLSLDYSQIDLRVLAHFTEDKALLETFQAGGDIHTAVAARVFEVAPEKVTPNQRRIAKVVNFGIIYGMSAFGLSQTLQTERAEAQKYIDKYFSKHPQVRDYMEKIVAFAKKYGYVDTLFGRRRLLPEINSSQYLVRSSAERMAINMPIQGTSSDIVKLAMNAVAELVKNSQIEARMLLQVHDELLFEVKPKKAQDISRRLISAMENCCQLKVPLTVNAKIGDNWSDMEDL
jgi:DNA polymerase I